MSKGNLLAALSVVGFVLVGALAAGAGDEDAAAKALYEEKCSICHDIDRSRSIRMTAEGWRTTVTRMKDENNCPITKEQAETIIGYLVKNNLKKAK